MGRQARRLRKPSAMGPIPDIYDRCFNLTGWPGHPAKGARAYPSYSLTLLLRCACSSFLISSGDSFGRSIVNVILLILPVKLKGTW